MPSSTRPATPISAADLAKEINKGPSMAPPATPTPPPAEEPRSEAVSTPPPAQLDTGKPIMQGLMANIGKDMAAKAAASEGKKSDAPAEDAPAKEAKADKKPVVNADDAPPVAKGTPKPLTDEELAPLPHDSTRTRERITFLNSEKNRIAAEKEAIKKELDALKSAPKTEANTEEIAKLREEHKALQDEATRLRRRYDWDNDAEAKAKYREPIALADKAIEDVFTRNGFGAPTLKAIKDSGGFAAFSRSMATYPVEVADPDAEGGKKIVNYTAAELARSFLSRMPIADAELVRQSVGRQEMLQNEEKAAIAKAQEDAKGYYENQTKAQREAAAQNEATNKKHADEYTAWQTKAEGETEWLKDRPVPDDATPEVRAKVEEFNATQKELREGLKKHPTNAIEYGQLKLDAARSRHLERTMAEKDSEIERLTAELKKKSAAQKTTGKGGSLLVKDGHKPEEEKKPMGSTNYMDAINKTMAKKAGVTADDE